MQTSSVAENDLEREQEESLRRASLDERAAEQSGEMASELGLEARAGAAPLGLDESLDGGAMLEETGCSTGFARVSRGGELHAASIGISLSQGNPWRE